VAGEDPQFSAFFLFPPSPSPPVPVESQLTVLFFFFPFFVWAKEIRGPLRCIVPPPSPSFVRIYSLLFSGLSVGTSGEGDDTHFNILFLFPFSVDSAIESLVFPPNSVFFLLFF